MTTIRARSDTPSSAHIAEEGRCPARREFMRSVGALALVASPLAALARADTSEGITFAAGPRPLVQYPEKRPLILVHSRPPHLETPFAIFNNGPITPNDAFFVRYHLANIPTSIDPATYRLSIGGKVRRPLSLSLKDLKSMPEQMEVVAVNQCSGNSRGYFSPRVWGEVPMPPMTTLNEAQARALAAYVLKQ